MELIHTAERRVYVEAAGSPLAIGEEIHASGLTGRSTDQFIYGSDQFFYLLFLCIKKIQFFLITTLFLQRSQSLETKSSNLRFNLS